MARVLILLFSFASYGLFLLVFLYLLAFLANLQTTALAEAWTLLKAWIPVSIDAGRQPGSPAAALLINVGLIALFGLQHSVMARQGFKAAWTRVVPKEAERSVYVLLSSIALVVLM
jgi:protein-S-isoprenylcysteine O-methyltransferase Ste14